LRHSVHGQQFSSREEEVLAQGANWEHDAGSNFSIRSAVDLLCFLGAIHSSDLEKFFQISKWLQEPTMKELNKKHIYDVITKRFIEAAPNASEESAMQSSMTRYTAEKYVYSIEGFRNSSDALDYLYKHYDKYGEDSKVKMLHLYGSEFRSLNSDDKINVIKAFEDGRIKSASKVFLFLFFSYVLRSN
jgi:hypothetical protein